MLDWLRYFPLVLGFRKNIEAYITPKGPYFPTLRPQQWCLGDTRFHFKAPWSNSVYGSRQYKRDARSRSPGKCSLLTEWRLSNFYPSLIPNRRWQYAPFHSRTWYFVGPWFSGPRGKLIMVASVVGQVEREDYKSASFFHPRVFETVIADYLSSYYGHEKAQRGPLYRGPVNWQLLPISPTVQAAAFDVHQIDQGRENPELTKHIVFPVSHDRFVHIRFNYNGKRLVKNSCDITPMLELNQAIVDTFRLEVGPTMQAQWEEVKKDCPEMSLSETFGELKWPIKPEDVGKRQVDDAQEKEVHEPVGKIAQEK